MHTPLTRSLQWCGLTNLAVFRPSSVISDQWVSYPPIYKKRRSGGSDLVGPRRTRYGWCANATKSEMLAILKIPIGKWPNRLDPTRVNLKKKVELLNGTLADSQNWAIWATDSVISGRNEPYLENRLTELQFVRRLVIKQAKTKRVT